MTFVILRLRRARTAKDDAPAGPDGTRPTPSSADTLTLRRPD